MTNSTEAVTINNTEFELFCDEQGFDYDSQLPEDKNEVRAARLAWNGALTSRAATTSEVAQAPVAWISFEDALPPLLSNGRGNTTYKTVLVTNNTTARNACGERSHVWLGSPYQSQDDGWCIYGAGKFLTHWMDPFAAPVAPAAPVSAGVIAAAEALIAADRAQALTTEHVNALENAIAIQRGEAKVPAAAQAEAVRTHTTQAGESVMGIALRQCGNEKEWRHILACNPQFADMLPHEYFPVGTVLTLPLPAAPASSTGERA